MQIKDEMKVYKIRDKETGLFSTGGMDPRWKKTGKAWSSRGALKSHLTQYCDPGFWDHRTNARVKRQVPESWEVVEFTFNVNQSATFSAREEAERPAKK